MAIRMRSGPDVAVVFEVRDWSKYGVGGRTVPNIERRLTNRGLTGAALDEAMIRGAARPNVEISQRAIDGARYLRHGGRVIVVFSLATTAYVLLTAPPEELERVIYEEAGGAIGGGVGAGTAVAACLVFGIATGGWGLLACGVVGGLGGGALGAWGGNQIYYAKERHIEQRLLETGTLGADDLFEHLPQVP